MMSSKVVCLLLISVCGLVACGGGGGGGSTGSSSLINPTDYTLPSAVSAIPPQN